MLPTDWSRPNSPPTNIALDTAGWEELTARYTSLAADDPVLPGVFALMKRAKATQVSIEYDYIDADYRDEFANFYATTFRPLPDRCHRLHFFKKQEYLGFTVIRPIIARPICRTILQPPREVAQSLACSARCEVHPYGFKYPVNGFPFLSQDFQFGVCAHAAVWMIAHYHHLKRAHGRYFISDIVDAARQHEVERSVPSTGLHQLQIAAAFRRLDLGPLQYIEEGVQALKESFERIACRYLNSGMPVLLIVPGHAMVLIGYGREQGSTFFIAHDDARGPYRKIGDAKSDPKRPWQGLVVPLPGKIYLTAEAAERTGREYMNALIATEENLAPLRKVPLRYRTYVVPSAEYKTRLTERGLTRDVVYWHRMTGTSNWIWLVEAQEETAAVRGRDCVVGEIAIDATSDPLTPFALFGNLPGMLMRWADLNGPMMRAPSEQSVELRYTSATAVHV